MKLFVSQHLLVLQQTFVCSSIKDYCVLSSHSLHWQRRRRYMYEYHNYRWQEIQTVRGQNTIVFDRTTYKGLL